MAPIRWTPLAADLLQAAHNFVASENPVAADRLVERIRAAVEILQAHPLAGRTGRIPGTRELVVHGTPYIVAYRIERAVVSILAVFHAAREWPAGF